MAGGRTHGPPGAFEGEGPQADDLTLPARRGAARVLTSHPVGGSAHNLPRTLSTGKMLFARVDGPCCATGLLAPTTAAAARHRTSQLFFLDCSQHPPPPPRLPVVRGRYLIKARKKLPGPSQRVGGGPWPRGTRGPEHHRHHLFISTTRAKNVLARNTCTHPPCYDHCPVLPRTFVLTTGSPARGVGS